ncbi:MAG TPA: hypothetical protein VD837_13035 [Terriglobales bacterium]|nr:hypothetical protein [Terriglobales bacterium]
MSATHRGTADLKKISWQSSWLSTASHTQMLLVASCVGVVVFILMAVVDTLMFNAGFSPFRIMIGSAGFAAILTSGLLLMLMHQVHERREAVRAQLRVIGETNHHIRNALELIQFSAHSTKDQQVKEQISGAVDRIQWVLRELLGETGAYAAQGEGKPGATAP